MSNTVSEPSVPAVAGQATVAAGAPGDAAAVIAAALGDRRNAPRVEVQLPCTIAVGAQVQDGMVRDVSPGGAMLNGVRGLLPGGLVRIRLDNRDDLRFVAEVRGVSLLGVHVAIVGAEEHPRWWDAIRELAPPPPGGWA